MIPAGQPPHGMDVTTTTSNSTAQRPATRCLLRCHSRLATGVCLTILLASFAAVNAFWRYLATGRWLDFRPIAYYQDFITPLGEIFRHPLDVLTYPWMIVMAGLLLGLVVLVPVLISVLYRPLAAAPFVIAVVVFGHSPILAVFLALALAIDTVLAATTKLRRDMPVLAVILGLAWGACYFAISALAGVDVAAALPLQRWALYAPFLIAFVSAVLAGAVVLGLARLTGFRQALVCVLLFVLPAAPVVVFYLRIGADELDYALIVNRLQTDGSIFEDEALEPWIRRHRDEGLNPQTARNRVKEDLDKRRKQLVDRCREFLERHAESDRRPAVMWLRAQAESLQLDELAFAAGLIKYVPSFALPASAEAWEAIGRAYPTAPQAALANWRLGGLALRAIASGGRRDPNELAHKADEHLHRAREALSEMFPAAADRRPPPPPTGLFSPAADVPSRAYYLGAAEAVERLIWLMEQNGVLKDPNSAEALGAYLDVNPKLPDYDKRLADLLNDTARKRESTPMGDNLLLAVALHTPDPYKRAEALVALAKDERTDAAIEANFELGKLALNTADARAIGLTVGLRTPEQYFKAVIAARPNPYQQKAAELLAALAARPKERE
jgi:hypothetical protein